MQLLDVDGLAARGIKKSPSQHYRNTKAGKFCRPIKIGNRCAYIAEEVDAYLRAEKYKRDYPPLKVELEEWIASEMTANKNPWAGDHIDKWVQAHIQPRSNGRK